MDVDGKFLLKISNSLWICWRIGMFYLRPHLLPHSQVLSGPLQGNRSCGLWVALHLHPAPLGAGGQSSELPIWAKASKRANDLRVALKAIAVSACQPSCIQIRRGGGHVNTFFLSFLVCLTEILCKYMKARRRQLYLANNTLTSTELPQIRLQKERRLLC